MGLHEHSYRVGYCAVCNFCELTSREIHLLELIELLEKRIPELKSNPVFSEFINQVEDVFEPIET